MCNILSLVNVKSFEQCTEQPLASYIKYYFSEDKNIRFSYSSIKRIQDKHNLLKFNIEIGKLHKYIFFSNIKIHWRL
jgi:hypothetical protein